MLALRPEHELRLVLQFVERDEGLAVYVIETPVGENAAAEIVLPRIEDVLRMTGQPDIHEDVGRGLFRALFPEALGAVYRAAFTQSTVSNQPLTLELRFDRNTLYVARYPWELLHDGTRFLLRAGSLVRSLPFAGVPQTTPVRDPLEVLLVSAHPKDQPPLKPQHDALLEALDAPIRADKLDLGYLFPPGWYSLTDWILAGAPRILHFDGHGTLARQGRLFFVDGEGNSDAVDAEVVGQAFSGSALQLAVLSAAHGAPDGCESELAMAAPGLLLAGVPAVVAMQRCLPEDLAIQFATTLYEALLVGHDIKTALGMARKTLAATPFWHVPALYLRGPMPAAPPGNSLDRRVDVVAPQAVPVHLPLRVGVWVRRTHTPVPSQHEIVRLLGLAPPDEPAADAGPGQLAATPLPSFDAGELALRITAPGFDVQDAAPRRVVLTAETDPPPVWFALTPRSLGRKQITFELVQGDSVVVTLQHKIDVREAVERTLSAVVASHGVNQSSSATWFDDDERPLVKVPARRPPSRTQPAMPAVVEQPEPPPEIDVVETVTEPVDRRLPMTPTQMVATDHETAERHRQARHQRHQDRRARRRRRLLRRIGYFALFIIGLLIFAWLNTVLR